MSRKVHANLSSAFNIFLLLDDLCLLRDCCNRVCLIPIEGRYLSRFSRDFHVTFGDIATVCPGDVNGRQQFRLESSGIRIIW